jgi:hypothetical protein
MLGQVEGQRQPSSNDGMDAAFLWFDNASASCTSPAPSWRCSCSTRTSRPCRPWTANAWASATPIRRWTTSGPTRHPIPEGSLLFLTTDGLIDQIGGAKDIAYGKRRMRDVLLATRTECARHVSAMLDDYQRGKASSRAATT